MNTRFHKPGQIARLLSPPNLLLAVITLFVFSEQRAFAQDSTQHAVGWEFSAQKGSGGNPVLVLHARVTDGWKLYSTTNPDTVGYSRVSLDSGSKATILGIEERGTLKRQKDVLFNGSETKFFTGVTDWLVSIRPSATDGTADLKGVVTFMAVKNDSVVGPADVAFRYGRTPDGAWVAKSTSLQQSATASNDLKKASIDLANPVNACGGTGAEGARGMLSIFFLGFLGGLLGLIMPCTFPMIPLTVAFFTKRTPSRSKGVGNAFLYGFFIFLIYVLISIPFYFLKANNANILNAISTNVWLNLVFAAIFLAFALSFFGLFEITLPSGLSNKVDSRSNLGSLSGIFFMALTLVIVSFSCTGPILGSLLVGALDQNGKAIQLTVALSGFGLALGLPFALFALFPNWLQSLPKSGGWMTSVKKTFAFVELALMIKFLSNADLVAHWGLLKREVFFAIWILIGIALVLYLFGKLSFPHDPPPAKLSGARLTAGIIFLAIVLYLLPGLTNTRYANLALVSGFPPPLSYSIYGSHVSPDKGVEADVINDYNKALALAKQEHKPLLIDFTGWACVNCRKMEENVWPQPEVKQLITKDYILVSLYVDDRKRLPDDQQFSFPTGDGSIKAIQTVGDKYATLQSENFKNASQPLYVVISPDEKLMTKPVGYTPNAAAYAQWLKCGLDAFQREKSTATR